jgi:hypothetical protein
LARQGGKTIPDKLYTAKGDDGTTGLLGGDRVPKYDPRLEAYGTLNEATSCTGLARATVKSGAVLTHTFPPATVIVTYTVVMTAANGCGSSIASKLVPVILIPRSIYLPVVLKIMRSFGKS